MKNNINLLSNLAQFFLKWEMFQTEVVGNTHFKLNNVLEKFVPLWDKVVKCCRAGQVTDDNKTHAHCMLEDYKHTLRICNNYCFSTATWLHERALTLHYTYIVCFVYILIYLSSAIER